MSYNAPPPPPGMPPMGAPYGDATAAFGERADWGKRVVATLIDGAIVIPVYILVFILGSISDVLGLLAGLVLYVGVIGYWIWNYGIKQGTTGQTIGKAVVGIKLIDAKTGQPVGTGLAIARGFVHIIDSLPCYVGYLWPLWDAKRETFTDKVLTHAVVLGEKKALADAIK